MRSLIIIEVEHGETTEPVEQFLDEACDLAYNIPGIELVTNSTVRVDLPACFVLDSGA